MKPTPFSRFRRVTLNAVCLFALAPLTASAVFIDGSIAMQGSVELDAPIPTATAFVSFSNATVAMGTQTGDYVGTAGTPVTITPFQFDPLLSPSPVSPVWTFTSGVTYSFVLESIMPASRTFLPTGSWFLEVAGTGTASITGFDDTPGVFSVTMTGNATSTSLGLSAFSFTAREERVPDGGASVFLLGLALVGLTAVQKFRAVRA